MTIKQIVPELIVIDVDKSIAFYEEVFGFTLVSRAPEAGPTVWAEIEKDGSHLMFQERNATADEIPSIANRSIPGTSLIVLRFWDATVVRDLWTNLSGSPSVVLPLRETEYGTVEFGITDPDGYFLLLAGE